MEKIARIASYSFLAFAAAFLFFYPPYHDAPRELDAGLIYQRLTFSNGRTTIHSIKIPREALSGNLELDIISGSSGPLQTRAFEQLIKENTDSSILAAVNGAYLNPNAPYMGRLRGPIVRKGLLYEVSSPEARWPSLRYRADGTISIDQLDLKTTLRIFGDTDINVEFNTHPGPDDISLWTNMGSLSESGAQCENPFALVDITGDSGALRLPDEKHIVSYLRPLENESIRSDGWALCAGKNISERIRHFLGGGKALPIEIVTSTLFENAYGICSGRPETPDELSDGFVLGTGRPLFFGTREGRTEFLISQYPNDALVDVAARTAFCWNDEDVYLIAAEGSANTIAELGRHAVFDSGRSGVSPAELADIAHTLFACSCAVLLDGGGSTGMFYASEAEKRGERPGQGQIALAPVEPVNSALVVNIAPDARGD